MLHKSTKPNTAISWDRFVLEHSGSFLQSWAWGKFQEKLKRQVWRIKNQDWGGQIIRYNLPLGRSYLYCPRGPLFVKKQELADFLSEVNKIKNKKDIFLRVEPPTFSPSSGEIEGGEKLGFKKISWDVQPSKTVILDITKSEDELLAAMHYKHRYNIRLAERKGVQIRIVPAQEDFYNFWELLRETACRNKFRTHSKEYYEKQLAIKDENLKILLFVAEYKKEIIATNIVNLFGRRATYMHGGSLYKYRYLMAPHLLQLEQIKEAKRQGCQRYDFWGIDEQKWPGVTRFKRGFGGQEVQYPGTSDLVFDKFWYKLYRLGRKVL